MPLIDRPILAVLGAAALVAVATVGMLSGGTGDAEAQARPSFSLPPQAREVAPDVLYLGSAYEHGVRVEGYAFIHRGNGAKPDNPGNGNGRGNGNGNGSGDSDASSCYSFIVKGARWRSVEAYLYNPATPTLTAEQQGQVGGLLAQTQGEWEAAGGVDIFGTGTETSDPLSADTSETDGLNEAYFAPIDDPGVIAVTTVWGIFYGPPHGREIVEWDMVFDDADFDWSTGDPVEGGAMDFLNIAAHEIGHAAGMGHTDGSDLCSEQTMYPTASTEETLKRDLDVGDEAGIAALY